MRWIIIFLFIASAAHAAPITTRDSGCAPAAATVTGVDYRADSGAGGRAVRSAETAETAEARTSVNGMDIYGGLPLAQYARGNENPASAAALADSDIALGRMQVYEDTVTLNGRDMLATNSGCD